MNPKDPSAFQDPTFTPLREKGSFTKVPPPPTQKKLNQDDPDWEDINPEIIRLCQRNGMARGCLNLYLEGHQTWLHTLETMVVVLGKELLANQEILVECRQEYVSLHNQVQSSKMIADAMELPEEKASDRFFALNAPQ